MSRPAHQPFSDAQAYLAWETEQANKHEYHDGEVFAMVGASEAHVTVALNVAMALRNHLRGSPCSVFISDMKLRVEEDNALFYPDIFVTCADSNRSQNHSKSAPVLIVEVLSPTTSAFDRGAKFAAYRKLPTLREHALIDPERLSLDLFRREGDSGGFKSEVQHLPTTSSHYHQLQPEGRATIASLKQQNHSNRAIARQLHRSPATISRELQRNACSCTYGSVHAQSQSLQRRRCGRPASKLHPDSILWAMVVHLLWLRWSPEQIALTLTRLYPPVHEHRVSHETIYNCIYAMPVGELRKELIAPPAPRPKQAAATQQGQGPQRPDS